MSEKVEIIAELKDLVSSEMAKITSQVNKLEGSLTRVGSSGAMGLNSGLTKSFLSANLLTTAITRAADAAFDFGKDSIRAFSDQESFQVGLKTMLGGNAAQAKVLNSQLLDLAKSTPFEATQLQASTKQLIAYGFKGSEVVSILKQLGDVSSGLGAQSFEPIVRAFGQIRSKGHLAGQELLQLTEQGFNPLEVISKRPANQ